MGKGGYGAAFCKEELAVARTGIERRGETNMKVKCCDICAEHEN